jgi:tetratricopeptide (TPR) repeat protein
MGSEAKSASTNSYVGCELGAILSAAAVIGDEFEFPILASVTDFDSVQLQTHLSESVQTGIVQRIDYDRYRFTDPTIRKFIYDGIEAALRSRLHREVGEVIARVHGTTAENSLDDLIYQFGAVPYPDFGETSECILRPHEQLEALAHHFSLSAMPENADKAIGYSIRAGEKSYRLQDYDRAGSHWRAALKMLPGSDGNDVLRAKVLMLLADEAISDGREALAYLERALPLLESLKATDWIGFLHSRIGYFLSTYHHGSTMDFSRAMQHFEFAEPVFNQSAGRAKLVNLFHDKSSAYLVSMKPHEGVAITRRGMEFCEEIGNDFWWILNAIHCSRHLLAFGRLSECFALEREAFQRAEPLEDPFCGRTVAWLGAVNFTDLLDPGAALDRYLAELERPRSEREPHGRLILQIQAAETYNVLGELGQAQRMLERIRGPSLDREATGSDDWARHTVGLSDDLKLARSQGNIDQISYRLGWLGGLDRIQGRMEEAEQAFLEALQINKQAPNLPRVVLNAADLCLLYFGMGRRENAQRMLPECLDILAGGEDWRGIEGMVRRAQAVVSALERRFLAADAEFESAIAIHRRYRRRWDEPETLLHWGLALLSAGERPRADEKFDRAITIYRDMGAGQSWINRINEIRARKGIPLTPPIEVTASSFPCQFAREGGLWTITHRNRTFRIKDMKGLRYIAHLLAHPREEFHVLDLVTAIDGVANANTRQTTEDLRVTNDLGSAGEILDQRSKTEYRQRRDELRADLNDASMANDPGHTRRVRAELEMLDEQLASAMGIGRRDRKTGDHSERARDRIRKSIHASLATIRENDPSLGHHLTTCIRTGYLCSYFPDPAAR